MALLNGKTALITGGSRGIGRGIVERFLEEGADVAFTYVSSFSRVSTMSMFRMVSWPMRSCGVNIDSPFSIVSRSGL